MQNYDVVFGKDALEIIDLTKSKKISMIGAFIPFIKKLKCRPDVKLHIIEKNKSVLKKDELKFYVDPNQIPKTIEQSDTIIITGRLL